MSVFTLWPGRGWGGGGASKGGFNPSWGRKRKNRGEKRNGGGKTRVGKKTWEWQPGKYVGGTVNLGPGGTNNKRNKPWSPLRSKQQPHKRGGVGGDKFLWRTGPGRGGDPHKLDSKNKEKGLCWGRERGQNAAVPIVCGGNQQKLLWGVPKGLLE